MKKMFDIYSTNVSIDRGQFRLPKEFQDVEPREQEFVIIQHSNKTLRIMTRKVYEEQYAKNVVPKILSFFSPSKYSPDKQWRGSFSQIHLKYLGNPTEVQMQGMSDFILIKSCDENLADAEIERLLDEKDQKTYGGSSD